MTITKRRIREHAMVTARHMIHDAIVAANRKPRDFRGEEINRLARQLVKRCPSMLKEAERYLTLSEAVRSKT
jgi:hypothetical protein